MSGAMLKYIRSHEWMPRILLCLVVVFLLIGVLLPLGNLLSIAFLNSEGEYVGGDNFKEYFSSPELYQSLTHTLYISSITAVVSVTLAFLYAFAIYRTHMVAKWMFRLIALLPLFAPTMMYGIGLTYLFGNQGLITTGFFGLFGGWEIPLYGPLGIILSEVIYTFPQSFLILSVSLAIADRNLYEAAETLGAKGMKTFFCVTVPQVKYGLVSALFVSFTLSFTDFGAPKVVGGSYNVLATDIYKHVIGQQNMSMGATVGLILLIPALIAFVVDRFVNKRQNASLTDKSKPYQVKPNRWRDTCFFLLCLFVAGIILLLFLSVLAASLIKTWPYNLSLTGDHYRFSTVVDHGLESLWNSVYIAFLTTVFGTVLIYFSAFLIEKFRFMKGVRRTGYFLSMLPMVVPGLVMGLAYVFFFNNPSYPFYFLYGTVAILVLANIMHFYSVPFITATSALKKLDREFELVSESMRIPFYRTFFQITVPMTLPAILEIAGYLFVNAMVTISAVVFLYSSELKPASVAIVNMDDAGNTASAAAMSMLIVLINIGVRLGIESLTLIFRKRTQAWQSR